MEHQYNEPPHNEVPSIMSNIVHPNNVKISGKVPHDNQNLVVVRINASSLALHVLRFYCNKTNLLKIRLFLIKQLLSQEISGEI